MNSNAIDKGRPVPAHLKLEVVTPADFTVWPEVLRETVFRLCTPTVAELFIERAERIAKSLQLAMISRLPSLAFNGSASPHGSARCSSSLPTFHLGQRTKGRLACA